MRTSNSTYVDPSLMGLDNTDPGMRELSRTLVNGSIARTQRVALPGPAIAAPADPITGPGTLAADMRNILNVDGPGTVAADMRATDNIVDQFGGPSAIAPGLVRPLQGFANGGVVGDSTQSPLDSALAAEGLQNHPVANIARSIYAQESGSGQNTQTSNRGAVGGMQVIPSTFNSVADPGWNINDPVDNARAGVRYIKQMHDMAGGDPALTAAGYYGGPGGMQKAAQGIPVSDPKNPGAPDTLQYAQQVVGRMGSSTPATGAASGKSYVTDPALLAQLNAPDAPQKQYVTDPELLKQLNAPAPSTSQPMRGNSFLQGLRDPIDGMVQLASHAAQNLRSGVTAAVPAGMAPQVLSTPGDPFVTVNNAIADKTGLVGKMPEGGIDQQIQSNESAYQKSRAANGESGFDGYRLLGNVANPVNLAPGAAGLKAVSPIARIAAGAAGGAGSAALAPVTDGDYTSEKAKQMGIGGVAGAVMAPVAGAIARLVSPNASTNADVALLKAEGVQPTIGQTIGGAWNAAEEKAQSIPILGDMIARARGQAREQFNTAAINRATAPIGQKAQGAGQDAVAAAGDALSNAYDAALAKVQAVPLDQQFHSQMGQLTGMAQNMVPAMRDKFNNTVSDIVLGRVGPQGSMLGSTYKDVDSELGRIASRYGKSQMASEQEYGDAIAQVQNLLKQQMMRTNPQVANELAAADQGWANLVRVEGAAKAAKNSNGIFTPAQLNAAAAGADDSVRKRAVSRGSALMQDLGTAGQNVLGNKVPDSGTAGRVLMNLGAIGSAALHPAIPLGLAAGGAAYTGPIQSALRAAVSARPAIAQPAAKTIRDVAPLLGAPAGLAANSAIAKPNGYANGGTIGGKPRTIATAARRYADGGLLGGVLPALYSAGDSLKRRIGDLVSDPIGSVQQAVGNADDKARNLNQMTSAATDEGMQYGPATQKLAGTLADAYSPVAAGTIGLDLKGQTQELLDALSKVPKGERVGLRLLPDDVPTPNIGDKLAPSFKWDDGVRTDKQLYGTSSMDLSSRDEDSVRQAITRLGLFNNQGQGYYPGNKLAIISGSSKRKGEDDGEAMVKDAVVRFLTDPPLGPR